jgi:hypothetical protein
VTQFSQALSIVLALLVMFTAFTFRLVLGNRIPPRFDPFWVRVKPNWSAICEDFKLCEVTKWKEFQEQSCAANKQEYSIVRDGFNFTTLSPTFAPHFYIRRRLAGKRQNVPVIEFGLVTEESSKKAIHPSDGRDEIPVALLPEILFYLFMHPEKRMKGNPEQSKAQLKEFGWTERERQPEDFWLNLPKVYHKYVEITYRGIGYG